MNPPDWARLGALVTRPRVIQILVALLATVCVTVVVNVTDDNGDGRPDRTTATVVLGGPGHKTITLPPAAQTIAARQAREDAAGHDAAAESDLHETAPPPVDVADQAQMLKPAGQPTIPETLTDAAPSVPGCSTTLVRNYSSRNGAPVLLGFIHWTGSASIPVSTADGLGIVHWFDTPAASASSSEITDDDGHCWLAVPETLKPWTQAFYNPWSVSDEHVNPGAGPLFTTAAGRRVVVRLMRGWHQRWNLPYQRAIVAKTPPCRIIRPGFLAHRDAGICGGGHPDVGNFDLDGLIREAAQGSCSTSCRRARALRARHAVTHHEIRRRHCAPLERTRSRRCVFLWHRNRALHAVAEREKVRL